MMETAQVVGGRAAVCLVVMVGRGLFDSPEHLGPQYIASFLREKGYAVNLRLARSAEEAVSGTPAWQGRLVFGFSLYCANFDLVKDAATLIKQKWTNSVVVAGGQSPTFIGEEVMAAIPAVDYCVVGDGEETMVELLGVVEGRARAEDCKGILFRDQGGVRRTVPREPMENLDSLPFPARDLYEQSVPKPPYRPRTREARNQNRPEKAGLARTQALKQARRSNSEIRRATGQ